MNNIIIDLGTNDLKDGDVRQKNYMGYTFKVSKVAGNLEFTIEKIEEPQQQPIV